MSQRDVIQIPVNSAPVIEFDSQAMAWYIRFSRKKVAKTVSEDKPGKMVVIDFDSAGQVVGVELLGVREFSLSLFGRLTGIDPAKINLEKTRFVSAGRDLVPS